MKHPNIVAVYDVGQTDGRTFVAMELITGRTVRKWAAQEKPSPSLVAEVMLAAAAGIAAAHEAGLLHRDIKPDNLMVADDGRVLVLDFGLARAEQAVPSAGPLVDSILTAPDQVLGTPRYAAPELLRTGEASPLTDQFAFGVSLFELLFGHPPFVGRSVVELLAAQRIPARVDGRELPGPLVQLLSRALEYEPAKRMADMGAVVDVLRRVATRRRRRVRTLAGVALALGMLGAGSAGFFLAQAQVPAVQAQIPDEVVALARAATHAAAQARYVYPPPHDPRAATAYQIVMQLEGVDGGTAAGAKLRREFAGALEGLGDRYWDRPGGRLFAADFYVQALLFEPDRERSRERAALTAPQLAVVEKRAAGAKFSDGELQAAEVLSALAAGDDKRLQKLASAGGLTATTSVQLDKLLRSRPVRVQRPRALTATGTAIDEAGADADAAGADTDAAGADAAAGGDASAGADAKAAGAADPDAVAASGDFPPSPPPMASPKAARLLVKKGRAALAKRRLDEAAKFFHRALERDRNSAAARIGLSHVEYERGRYTDSARYAKLAIRVAPRRAAYHLQLGDAYYKTLQYAQAKAAYETAKRLGHSRAQSRLDRMAKRAGG